MPVFFLFFMIIITSQPIPSYSIHHNLILPYMEKIFCLPKISISELQQTVKQKRTTHKKYINGRGEEERDGMHHDGIKVSSPFYQRCSKGGICTCQVHRFKKVSPVAVPHRSTHQNLSPLARCSDSESSLQQRAKRETKTTLIQQPTSPYQYLKSLPNRLPVNNRPENAAQERKSSMLLQYAKTIPKLPTRKTLKSQKDKIEEMNETGCKVETLNMEFIRLVSARLSNQKFKQKYLKTLFGFIKMKSVKDRTYLINSKAYLHNSLNMLLNHIDMATLLDYQQLSQEQIAQVAYYMNCFPDRVRGILDDLGRAVSEMEKALAEMRENQQRNKENEASVDSHNGEFTMENVLTETKEDRHGLTTKESLLNELDQNNTSIISLSNVEDQHKSHNKGSLKRSSSRRMNDLFTSTISKQFIPVSEKQKHNEQPMPIPIRKSIKINHKSSKENQEKEMMNRSLRSTVLMTVDEAEKQKEQPIQKKITKSKKSRIKTKNTAEMDDKYSKIQFQKYLTRRSFQNLTSSIDKLDQNDMDRALTLFKDLKVDHFLDNQEKIEDIIKTFNPLFNEKSLHHFLRHIVMQRDRRFIERLQRDLDNMLHQVKKNDPRNRDVDDFFDVKAEKKVPVYMNKMAKCREIKLDRRDTIQHIKYFQAEEQIERHKTKQKSVKQHLQQVDLQGITFATIDPTLSTVLTHFQSKEPQYYRSTHIPDLPDQKRILQYMKRKHQGTFNYLASQIRTLCRSLSKQPVQ